MRSTVAERLQAGYTSVVRTKKLIIDHVLDDGPLKGWRISLLEVPHAGSATGYAQQTVVERPTEQAAIDEDLAHKLGAILPLYRIDPASNRFVWDG